MIADAVTAEARASSSVQASGMSVSTSGMSVIVYGKGGAGGARSRVAMRATKCSNFPTSQLSKRTVQPSPAASHSSRRVARFSCAPCCTRRSHCRDSSSLGTIWNALRYCASSERLTAARTAIPRCVWRESNSCGLSECRMQISRMMEPLKRLRRYVGLRASPSSRSRTDDVPVIAKMMRAVMRSPSAVRIDASLGGGI